MVTYLYSLVQLCYEDIRTLQTKYCYLCGECSECMDHRGFASPHSMCFLGLHCSGSRVLCRALSKAGSAFHALPRSKPLRFGFLGTLKVHRFGWACILCPFQVQASQTTRCLVSTLSQMSRASQSPPWSQTLSFWDAP